MSSRISLSLLLLVCAAPGWSAEVKMGKEVFRKQCALCHTAEPNDGGGAQGPELIGVFGTQAGSSAAFSYTAALKGSRLTWDGPTLDRFLSAPSKVVPGTAMVNAVPDKLERANVIAYLESVKGAKSAAGTIAAESKGEADWKLDAPGRVHRIDLNDLPKPFATPSARNSPKLIKKPAGAKLSVPAGFAVNEFATGLSSPRAMRVAPNGDIFLTETDAGIVTVLRPSADGTKAEAVSTFAKGLQDPFGVQFYPTTGDPKWVYVAETNRVVRYAYKVGDMKAGAAAQTVIPQLAPTAGGHSTRDIAFSPDGKRMFVSVGSQSNVAEDLPKKTPAEIKAWEARHGLGAAWDYEQNRATVLVFDVGTSRPGKIFASGIRNCVGLTVQPATGDLWCTTNERDLLGDDLVPDYSTRVKEGGFYGWPWYYMGQYEDPRLKGDRPDLAGKAIAPDVPFRAHSAALNLAFYTATSGKSAFPKEYVGDGFAVLHGSWNRAFRTGHKVVRVPMKDGIPTGDYVDFMVGFIADDGNSWGRPVGTTVASDGSLLISDDGGNIVYRVSYAK